jgi:hypothetical protein
MRARVISSDNTSPVVCIECDENEPVCCFAISHSGVAGGRILRVRVAVGFVEPHQFCLHVDFFDLCQHLKRTKFTCERSEQSFSAFDVYLSELLLDVVEFAQVVFNGRETQKVRLGDP